MELISSINSLDIRVMHYMVELKVIKLMISLMKLI